LDCLKLFEKDEQETREYAVFCCNLGSSLAESGELKLSIKFFNVALAIHKKLKNDFDVALLHFNIGNVYKYSNNWQASVDHYKSALKGFSEQRDKKMQIYCLTSLGHFFAQLGVNEEVKKYLSQIWPFRKTFSSEISWSFTMLLSHFANMTGRCTKALRFAQKSLEFAKSTGNNAYISTTESAIATLLVQQGKLKQAINISENVYSKSKTDRESLEHAYTLATMYADSGNLLQAINLLKECMKEVHRRRQQLDGNERYLFMERYAEIGRKYVSLLADDGQWKNAFVATEDIQARTILDHMFRHQIKKQEKRVIKAGPQGRLFLESPEFEDIVSFCSKETVHILKFFFQKDDELLIWLLFPDGSIDGWYATSAIPCMHKVLNSLPVRHYLESSQMASLEGNTIKIDPTSLDKSLERLHINWDEIKINLYSLYNELFPVRIRSYLDKNCGKLAIIPHMQLFALPFADLGPSPGSCLGKNWTICTVPSAGVALQQDIRRDLTKNKLSKSDLNSLFIGDCGHQAVALPILPNSTDKFALMEFSNLPGARAEVMHLGEKFDSQPLMGTNASRTNVLKHFNTSNIMHFATHGLWDPLISDRSFLIFEGGPLSAMEISELSTHAELVFLSACQTGLGLPRPDSYIGLSQSFLIAGARAVLVSLWPIPDMATIAFVEMFYDNFERGSSPAEALQLTQNLMRSDPRWGGEFLWAAFQLSGWSFYPIFNNEVDNVYGGPAFCAGDVLWDGTSGDIFPLENYCDFIQDWGKGAFIKKGKIIELLKSEKIESHT
jgi:CHAT domain-containing protein/tetratricopeptide (TPR) repeat protein